jgi:hypothetical protein
MTWVALLVGILAGAQLFGRLEGRVDSLQYRVDLLEAWRRAVGKRLAEKAKWG